MSAPVFISYSSKDRPIARKICAAVEERGFACWMADRNVRPGEDFQIEIVRAIRSARVMLLVFTGNANESAEVRKEMALASQENLPLIPIRMGHVKPAEAFAYQLVTRQFIDLAEDWDHEIRRLTQSLEEATGIKAAVKHERVPIPDDMPLPPVSRAPVEHPPPQAMSRGGSGMAPPEVRERKAGLGDQNWALPAALTIGAALTILAVLLTRDQGVSTALRNWTPPLLAVVAIVSLIAMTLGVALLADSESDSFGEALARSLVAIGLTLIVWIIYGYSLAFAGGGDFIGGFSRAFLHEVGALELPTYTAGVTIPEWSFLIFQGCVASLASVLVVGAFGRRMTLSALICFVPIWVTLVYFPLVHMVFYWAGPDAIANAAKALAAAADAGAKTAAQARLDEISADAGFLFKKGTIDYAGGTVVAICAGVAGLIGYLFVGRTITIADRRAAAALRPSGLILAWLAWLGVNAASYLDLGDPVTRLAIANCFSATAAGVAAGLMTEWTFRGRPTLGGVLYGGLGAIIAIAASACFAGTAGAALLGMCAGIVAVLSAGYAFGPLPTLPFIYLANGTLGTLAAAILANPALGGTGIMDYSIGRIANYGVLDQLASQFWAVATTILWSGVASTIVCTIVNATIGLLRAEKRLGS